MNKGQLRFGDYALILLMLALFVLVSLVYQVNQKFSFDQTQMLLKGFFAIFEGSYIPYGNEASTLGNLPGMLSSWVIGFPLQIEMHPFAPIVLQLGIRIIAILLFTNALCLIFDRKIVLLGTFLFALNPWLLYQTMLYNPSYLALGSTLAFNCLVRLRNDRHLGTTNVGRFFSSLFLVLAIGYSLQFHFSWPVLVVMIGIMWLRRDIKVSYIGIVVGVAIIAASLWPYIQAVMRNPIILESPDAYSKDRYIGYGLVHVYPVLKGILYWFRFGSFSFTSKAIYPEITDEFSDVLVVLTYIWIGIASVVGAATVLFSIYCNYFTVGKFSLGNSSYHLRFIRGMTISALLAVFVASALNTLTLNFWQIAIIFPFALMPILAYFSVRNKHTKLFVIVSIVCFICANALGSTYSDKFDFRGNYTASIYHNCLLVYSKTQCQPFAQGLTEGQRHEVELKTIGNPGSIDAAKRVFRGLNLDANFHPLDPNLVLSSDGIAPTADTSVSAPNSTSATSAVADASAPDSANAALGTANTAPDNAKTAPNTANAALDDAKETADGAPAAPATTPAAPATTQAAPAKDAPGALASQAAAASIPVDSATGVTKANAANRTVTVQAEAQVDTSSPGDNSSETSTSNTIKSPVLANISPEHLAEIVKASAPVFNNSDQAPGVNPGSSANSALLPVLSGTSPNGNLAADKTQAAINSIQGATNSTPDGNAVNIQSESTNPISSGRQGRILDKGQGASGEIVLY